MVRYPCASHKGIEGNGGINLHILNLFTRQRQVVNDKPQPLTSQGKEDPRYPLNRRLGGGDGGRRQNCCACSGEEKKLLSLPEIEPRTDQSVA
jgi:hypothetical protein